MSTEITAWRANNGVLFETESEANDYEEYLIFKGSNFFALIQEINLYLVNYSVHNPITREILQVVGIDSDSQFVNKLIISTDFIGCNNLTAARVNSLQNIANTYKTYNLLIPHWAISQQV